MNTKPPLFSEYSSTTRSAPASSPQCDGSVVRRWSMPRAPMACRLTTERLRGKARLSHSCSAPLHVHGHTFQVEE